MGWTGYAKHKFVALLRPATYVWVVGFRTIDDIGVDGVREFRDKGESVGAGRETGNHELVLMCCIRLILVGWLTEWWLTLYSRLIARFHVRIGK